MTVFPNTAILIDFRMNDIKKRTLKILFFAPLQRFKKILIKRIKDVAYKREREGFLVEFESYFQKLRVPFDQVARGEKVVPKQVHLLGFGFDGTACFRKGARLGPSAIREASSGLESYSPYLDFDLSELAHLVSDLGDLKVEESDDITENFLSTTRALENTSSLLNLKEDQVKFLLIGGEHSCSYGLMKEYLGRFEDLLIIHLDAHADLRDGYEGFYYSHASIIRRVMDHFEKGHQLLQYGIRSGTSEEYRLMKKQNSICLSREDFFRKLEEVPSCRPVYLTLDLDFFDPCFFPGTGTPEPGGEDFHFFIKLIKILINKNLVGSDVTELAPEIDSTGNSSVFAAKVVRELLIALAWSLK